MPLKRVSDNKNKVVPKKSSNLFKSKPVKEDTPPKYKDLKEVMDMNRPYSMLFSGVEDDTNFNLLYDMGIRNFLISYHYVQRKHLNMKYYEDKGIKFFVDSGAFTYISNLEFQEYKEEQWEEQIKKYLRWAEKHQNIIFAIASLDIEYLVGGDLVQEWNEKYFEPFMLRTGIPVCFVHHESSTKLSWEQYCQRYPYVGISWGGMDNQGNDVNYGINKLKVAEKYNALVHGMAMTQTSLLTKLPFYTSDSTTWLVGLQYGEVNYWNGTKMSRLKKDKWKGTMLSQLCDKGFDEEKLLEEDKEELVKVNVHAFIEAEKYVQDRLKTRMYWLRPKSNKRSESDLASINYPSASMLEGDFTNWEDYARDFNISTEDKESKYCVIDLTCFMNWYEDPYQEYINKHYIPQTIKDLHDLWVNRIVQSEEERIEDLIEFYTEVLLGNNDKLINLGTNFDRIVKERDSYVEDEEYELEDISDLEINNTLSKFLPESSSAKEIDELDDEIFREHDIIPVRDTKGRFIKGQRQVLKPKKLYSSKFPKMSCDSCFEAQKCPEYKAGYVCAFNKLFNRFDTRDNADIIQAMQGIVDFSLTRLQKSMMFEMLEGGMPDPNTSGLMDQSMKYLTQLNAMYASGNREVLKQTKVLKSDGSEETTTQITNPQQGGILEKIFGNMGSTKEENTDKEDSNIIDN